MAISGFGRRSDDTGTTSTSAAAASNASSGSTPLGNLTAFIDQGSEFEGKLSFKDTVRIDGTFSGEISSDNTLIVGETGEIHAKIQSVCVVISGLVEGDIIASQQVVLHKTAVVNGDISAPSFVVEEGAQMNGLIRMGNQSGKASLSAVSGGDAASADKNHGNKHDVNKGGGKPS